MVYVVVGRCAKQKKDFSGVWHVDDPILFCLLGLGIFKMS
jgi:hypothetical protein